MKEGKQGKKGKKGKKGRYVSPPPPPPLETPSDCEVIEPPAECEVIHPAPAEFDLDYPQAAPCDVDASSDRYPIPGSPAEPIPEYSNTPWALENFEEVDVPVGNGHATPAGSENTIETENSLCPARATHLLEGDKWKDCRSCRAVLRQVAIQLSRAGNTSEDGYDMLDGVTG
jgi:hypothetical protein